MSLLVSDNDMSSPARGGLRGQSVGHRTQVAAATTLAVTVRSDNLQERTSTQMRHRLSQRELPHARLLPQLSAPPAPAPFAGSDQLLEAAEHMFVARMQAAQGDSSEPSEQEMPETAKPLAEMYTNYFHESFQLTGDDIPVRHICGETDLSPLEIEIVLALLLGHLGLLPVMVKTCGDVLSLLNATTSTELQALRFMRPHNRLHAPEDELYRFLGDLTMTLHRRAEVMDFMFLGGTEWKTMKKVSLSVRRHMKRLEHALHHHPEWPLAQLLRNAGHDDPRCQTMILILLGKELGHFYTGHKLYKGDFLTKAVCNSPHELRKTYDLLRSDSPLISQDWVQPASGYASLLEDGADDLGEIEFELTDKSLQMVQIERARRSERGSYCTIRTPMIKLSQLVLADEVKHSIKIALAQVRRSKTLIEEWGLGSIIPYGRAVTLLFSGPPGVGKTACAEAFAEEIDRKLLVADYSRIESCFVGGTEKGIVRTFREAERHKAVLFWDEADAMFYDRNDGMHTWEVRHVNVLLQELERFDGVCILATNRKTHLDPALERRLSLRVAFTRPDQAMRRHIWAKLVPKKMPVAPDVDWDALSRDDLSGAQIKNAIINAARAALSREDMPMITMDDFRGAIRTEISSSLDDDNRPRIGFLN